MKRQICIGILSLFTFGSNINGQQYLGWDFKITEKNKARFAVYPSPDTLYNCYIIKQLEIGEENGVTGYFEARKINDFSTGRLLLFSPKGDSLEVTNYLDGKKNGSSFKWFDSGEFYGKQNFLNDKEEGISEWFFKNGQISAKYEMYKGERIKENYWNEDGSVQNNIKEANKPPLFKGGIQAFSELIVSRLIYPPSCKINGIEGRVVVRFLVDIDGSVSDVQIIKAIDPDLDREALRVFEKAPKWTPGKMHNQVVKVRYVMPIIFELRGSTYSRTKIQSGADKRLNNMNRRY